MANTGKAVHIVGYAFEYECVNACTLRVHFSQYLDCGGGTTSSGNLVWQADTVGCTAPSPVSAWTSVVITEITPLCPTAVSNCTSGSSSLYGTRQYYYSRDYDICNASPCVYDLTWETCCRSASNTSFINPGSYSLSARNNIVNTAIAGCNNSPVYNQHPFFVHCLGQSGTFDFGAIDPDGDSLVYSLSNVYTSFGNPVTYNNNYSPTSPLGPNWIVRLDSQTGLLEIDPTPSSYEIAAIGIKVDEYRNGVLIASHLRDFQLTILPCPNNSYPEFEAIQNPVNCTVNDRDIYVCNSGQICFDLPTSDINAGQTLNLTWDQQLANASFSELGNSSITDTILGSSSNPPTAHFCFNPPSPGTYFLNVRLEDNACPFFGYRDQIYKIHVGNGPISATASALQTSCPSVDFAASGCGMANLTYQWSGAGGLSGNTANISHTYSGPGAYPWQVIVSNGVSADTIRDTIVVGSPSYASLIQGFGFLAPCAGLLYDTIHANAGYTNYTWSNGMSGPDLPVYIGGNYGLTVTDQNGCIYYDSVNVNWNPPSVYGNISTSLGQALQNQKVLLITYDSLSNSLSVVDSIWTDSAGYYHFCNVTDSIVYIKAVPSAFDYPNEMPTYADTTVYWNAAQAFVSYSQFPLQHDFATIFGMNSGGSGFLGGIITEGANKVAGLGDPVPNVTIFLRKRSNGDLLGYRITNVNGYFSFPGIPFDDYEFAVDVPRVDHILVPNLLIDNSHPFYDSLDFRLHSTYLELVMPTVAIESPEEGFEVEVLPNPFANVASLRLNLDSDSEVRISIWDALGKHIETLHRGKMVRGQYQFEIGTNLPSGIYFARLEINGQANLIKLLKSK